MAFDEVEAGGEGLMEGFDGVVRRQGEELFGDDFGIHGRVGGAACDGGEAVEVGFGDDAEVEELAVKLGLGRENGKAGAAGENLVRRRDEGEGAVAGADGAEDGVARSEDAAGTAWGFFPREVWDGEDFVVLGVRP